MIKGSTHEDIDFFNIYVPIISSVKKNMSEITSS